MRYLFFEIILFKSEKRKNKESSRPSYSNSISLAAVRAVEWGLVIFMTSHIIRLRLCSYFASELTNFHNWSQTFLFPRFLLIDKYIFSLVINFELMSETIISK